MTTGQLISYGKLREEDEGYDHREQINTGCMAATIRQVIMPRVVPRVQAAVEEGCSVTPGHLPFARTSVAHEFNARRVAASQPWNR